jgi:hypothetical protein
VPEALNIDVHNGDTGRISTLEVAAVLIGLLEA